MDPPAATKDAGWVPPEAVPHAPAEVSMSWPATMAPMHWIGFIGDPLRAHVWDPMELPASAAPPI
jgi:hypothetical protein